MELSMLETSQMLADHPIAKCNEKFKSAYLNLLESFIEKYASDDLWARQTLRLYIKRFLGSEESYQRKYDLRSITASALPLRLRRLWFRKYRYCPVLDSLFICAYNDQGKAAAIFRELLLIYPKHRWAELQQVFDSLYGNSSISGNVAQDYMMTCWRMNRAFAQEKPVKVLITANMSAGKSTLLNALIGKKVNKTRNDTCTAKIHHIVNKPYEDGYCYELDHLLELDADYSTLMEDNSDNKSSEIIVGTYFRTIGPRARRIRVIDTPGVNSSQDIAHRDLTRSVISSTDADILIYLLNGENIGSEDDREHLMFISKNYHGRIIFVVNKLDKFKQREDSVSETLRTVMADLKSIGFESPKVVPVSAYAAYLAKSSIYGEELDEDAQDEIGRITRKMKKPEYQFETYYPEEVQKNVSLSNKSEDYQLLLHSGILHLENMLLNQIN